jgi:hypothetical protein
MTDAEKAKEVSKINNALISAKYELKTIRKKLKKAEKEYDKFTNNEYKKIKRIVELELKLEGLR